MITENEYRILAQLTYINYDKDRYGKTINESDYKNKTLNSLFINDVFKHQNDKSYLHWKSEIDKIKNDWKIIEYKNNNESNGFVGVAFQNVNTDEIVVGFRGTEPFVNKGMYQDLIEDFQLSLFNSPLGKPEQFEVAYQFAQNIIDNHDGNITFTGHSLGGGLCQYASYKTGVKGTTFNGVGIGQAIGLSEEEAKKVNVVDIVNKDDLIGTYGLQLGTTKYIKGNNEPMSNENMDNLITVSKGLGIDLIQNNRFTKATVGLVMNKSELGGELLSPHELSSMSDNFDENGNLIYDNSVKNEKMIELTSNLYKDSALLSGFIHLDNIITDGSFQKIIKSIERNAVVDMKILEYMNEHHDEYMERLKNNFQDYRVDIYKKIGADSSNKEKYLREGINDYVNDSIDNINNYFSESMVELGELGKILASVKEDESVKDFSSLLEKINGSYILNKSERKDYVINIMDISKGIDSICDNATSWINNFLRFKKSYIREVVKIVDENMGQLIKENDSVESLPAIIDSQREKIFDSLKNNMLVIDNQVKGEMNLLESILKINEKAYVSIFNTGINPMFEVLSNDNISNEIIENLKMTLNDNTKISLNDLYMNDYINESFKNSVLHLENRYKKTKLPGCPLIIDLDGDGIHTVGLEKGIYFDHDNSGFAESTSWIDGKDGFLVRDLNKNGIIDGGNELFGNNSYSANSEGFENGFEALKSVDENKDGVIDSKDSTFNNLLIWKDINMNGKTDEGELSSLESNSISSISTEYEEEYYPRPDRSGTTLKQNGKYEDTDGKEMDVKDLWFKVDTINTKDLNEVELENFALNFPNLKGFGNTSDLYQAIAKDKSGKLKNVINEFLICDDLNKKYDLIDEIIFLWTGVDTIEKNRIESNNTSIDTIENTKKICALEKFLGLEFLSIWNKENKYGYYSSIKEQITNYDNLKDDIYFSLIMGTNFKLDITSDFSYSNTDNIKMSLNSLVDNITEVLKGHNEVGSLFINRYKDSLGRMNILSDKNIMDFINLLGKQVKGFVKDLFEIDDKIFIGNDRDNVILGDSGDDYINGGLGNDTLEGDSGNDVYIYKEGSGIDKIYDNYGDRDRLIFGKNINRENLIFSKNDSQLIISFENSTDQVIITNYFGRFSLKSVEIIEFYDGSKLDYQEIFDEVLKGSSNNDIIEGIWRIENTIDGGEGNDVLKGKHEDDTISGGFGHDYIDGINGDDKLFGNEGNDEIIGDIGNDIINGGKGYDYLDGGFGDDTYVYNLGDGVDFINEQWSSKDVLKFGRGITKEMISFKRNEDDLEIVLNEDDQIVIKSCFGLYARGVSIEKIVFDNGIEMSEEDICLEVLKCDDKDNTVNGIEDEENTIYGLGGRDILIGEDYKDNLYGGSGNDELHGGFGSDYIDGGTGNDKLFAGGGNDVLIGGKGNDYIEDYNGNDTYIFNLGDGSDVIKDGLGSSDMIIFGEGIEKENLILRKNDTNLDISFNNTDDKLKIINQFHEYSKYYQIEKLKFFNGDEILLNDINVVDIEKINEIEGEKNINDIIKGTSNNDKIRTFSGDDVINSGSGNDIIEAGSGNDNIYGQNGNDKIYGSDGEDIIDGGRGDDLLYGGHQSDTYIFGKGCGTDTIYDFSNNNVIKMKDDVVRENINMYFNKGDLYIELDKNNGTDKLIVDRFLMNYEDWNLSGIQFSDGEVWSSSEIVDSIFSGSDNDDCINNYIDDDVEIHGANGNDKITGDIGNDKIYGDSGYDILDGSSGNDQIFGGLGNDKLNGGAGNDILDGGKGRDVLIDGRGENQFIFAKGYGFDTVIAGESMSNVLLKNIKMEDVEVYQKHSDLFIDITSNETNDLLKITDFFDDDDMGIQSFIFDSGEVWSRNEVISKVFNGTDGSDIIYGIYKKDDVISGGNGQDSLYASSGNDTLLGGYGDDILDGSYGDDILNGGYGNDNLNGGKGNDIYIFEEKWGRDIIYDYSSSNDIEEDIIDIKSLKCSEIMFKKNDKNLVLEEIGENNSITISGWYTGEKSQIQKVVLSDGKMIDNSKIDQLIQAMASFEDSTGIYWDEAAKSSNEDYLDIINQFYSSSAS